MDNMDTRSKCSRLKLPAIKEVKDDVELFTGIRQRRNVLSEMLKHTNDKSIYKVERNRSPEQVLSDDETRHKDKYNSRDTTTS